MDFNKIRESKGYQDLKAEFENLGKSQNDLNYAIIQIESAAKQIGLNRDIKPLKVKSRRFTERFNNKLIKGNKKINFDKKN